MLDNDKRKRRSLPHPQNKKLKIFAWRIMKILVSLEILTSMEITQQVKEMNPVLDMLHMIFSEEPSNL